MRRSLDGLQSKTLILHTGLKYKLCHGLKDSRLLWIIGKVLCLVLFSYLNIFSFRQDIRLELLSVFSKVRLLSSDEDQPVRNCCFKYR